ncbi:MAG: leucine-rich repeat protein [Clostridia bacterium]|nr:leucine-rich repeat protein [Clostridia bacterium]
MMKPFYPHKTLLFLTAVVLAIAALAVPTAAVGAENLTRVDYGDGREIVYDRDARTLTVRGIDLFETAAGTGSDAARSYPWFVFASETDTIVIDGGTVIPDYAFYGWQGTVSVELPETLKTIGKYAFGNCYGLTEVDLPGGLEYVKDYAFSGCRNLSVLSIPDESTVFLCSYSFQNCGLSDLTVPGGVRVTGRGIFGGCDSLETVTVSGNVVRNYRIAFAQAKNLHHVNIAEGETAIPNKSFAGNFSLYTVTLPSTLTSIGNSAFSGCWNLRDVVIPESVKVIGADAFRECKSLTSVTLSEGLESIRYNAFMESGLTSVRIPDSVITVESEAFYRCPLTCVEAGDGTSISRSAFNDCYCLPDDLFREYVFGGSIKDENAGVYYGTWEFDPDTQTLSLRISDFYSGFENYTEYSWAPHSENVEHIVADDGWYRGETLFKVRNHPNVKDVTVGWGIPNIADDAFTGCDSLEAVYYCNYCYFLTNKDAITESSRPGLRIAARGDVNGDGRINAKDSLALKKIIVGDLPYDEDSLEGKLMLFAADMDIDGYVTAKDSKYLKQYLACIDVDGILFPPPSDAA